MVRHDNRCENSETNSNPFWTVKDLNTQNKLISLDLNIGV